MEKNKGKLQKPGYRERKGRRERSGCEFTKLPPM
jgi:hypothetical protein